MMTLRAVLMALVAVLTAAMPALAQDRGSASRPEILQGAGATFPAPLYKKWIGAYRRLDPTTHIEYKDVGSGEGIKRFLEGEVDFGATDAALTDEQIAGARNGAVLVPATAGMIVLTYNLPGLNGPLKLSRDTYVALLLGKIPKWSDARIQATNPGLNLPDRDIVLVARQDSSGTTFALTNHLSTISQQWRDRGPGAGKVIGWPASTMLVRGNEGVAGRVKTSVGSVGYVEYGFAKHLGLPVAHLENKAGRFVAPGAGVGEATLAANLGRMPANLRFFLPDPDGAEAYPIVTFSWLVLRQRYSDPVKAQALKRFVAWGLGEGQDLGPDLGYIRLPGEVADLGTAALADIH
jgi:phosphate transport system substrate-binding protein